MDGFRKWVAFKLDRLHWRLWWVQHVACVLIGHVPILLEGGTVCAYCLKARPEGSARA